MKYAVLSDIHSNIEAFKATVEYAQHLGVEKYWCLGDLIGYGPDPKKCVEFMRSLPFKAYVGGNHESALLSLDLSNMNKVASSAIYYTNDQLSKEELDWIYNTAYWTQDFGKIAVAHGSYYNPEKFAYLSLYEYERKMNFQEMQDNQINTLFVGHTHRPSLMVKNEKGYPVYDDVEFINLKDIGRCAIDVGSVGQPRDKDVRASFAVYDSDEQTVVRHRVEYDYEKTADKIKKVGLPLRLAERLKEGK